MKRWIHFAVVAAAVLLVGGLLAVPRDAGYTAYSHMGEQDAAKFLAAYPDKAGTKLDNCNLCHSGGSYIQGGKTTTLGSCQWCHYKYGYDASGPIAATLNAYGADYKAAGRNVAAIGAIDTRDSDGMATPTGRRFSLSATLATPLTTPPKYPLLPESTAGTTWRRCLRTHSSC